MAYRIGFALYQVPQHIDGLHIAAIVEHVPRDDRLQPQCKAPAHKQRLVIQRAVAQPVAVKVADRVIVGPLAQRQCHVLILKIVKMRHVQTRRGQRRLTQSQR